MNQQAGVFFLSIPKQPNSEREAIELAHEHVKNTMLNLGPTPERDALQVVNEELMRRLTKYRMADEQAELRSSLQNRLAELEQTMVALRAEIAKLSR